GPVLRRRARSRERLPAPVCPRRGAHAIRILAAYGDRECTDAGRGRPPPPRRLRGQRRKARGNVGSPPPRVGGSRPGAESATTRRWAMTSTPPNESLRRTTRSKTKRRPAFQCAQVRCAHEKELRSYRAHW